MVLFVLVDKKHLLSPSFTLGYLDQYLGTRSSIAVKALCYKPEGRGFQMRCNFSMYIILPTSLGPGVHSAYNREYQKQKNNVSGE
jgi:hypothetical protein